MSSMASSARATVGRSAKSGNLTSGLLGLFVGWHPHRGAFANPAKLDLSWARPPVRLPNADLSVDLCGQRRGVEAAPGAFEDFALCLAGQ